MKDDMTFISEVANQANKSASENYILRAQLEKSNLTLIELKRFLRTDAAKELLEEIIKQNNSVLEGNLNIKNFVTENK